MMIPADVRRAGLLLKEEPDHLKAVACLYAELREQVESNDQLRAKVRELEALEASTLRDEKKQLENELTEVRATVERAVNLLNDRSWQ